MTILNAAGIFTETHIQLPMQVILDPPVTTQGLSITTRCHAPAAEEIPHLLAALAVHRPLAAAHAHRGQLRPRPSVAQAGHVLHHHARAFLHAAVALLPRAM